MSVRAEVRGAQPENIVSFFLQAEGEGSVTLMAEDSNEEEWYVLGIRPGAYGLELVRHEFLPDEFFAIDEKARIREAQPDGL